MAAELVMAAEAAQDPEEAYESHRMSLGKK